LCPPYFEKGSATHGSDPPTFCVPPNFVVPRKICFTHVIKTKFLPPIIYFSPANLKSYGPGGNWLIVFE